MTDYLPAIILLGIFIVGMIVLNPFSDKDTSFIAPCPHCHVGQMTLEYWSEDSAEVDTIIPCSECGCNYSLTEKR